eukprot:485464_1
MPCRPLVSLGLYPRWHWSSWTFQIMIDSISQTRQTDKCNRKKLILLVQRVRFALHDQDAKTGHNTDGLLSPISDDIPAHITNEYVVPEERSVFSSIEDRREWKRKPVIDALSTLNKVYFVEHPEDQEMQKIQDQCDDDNHPREPQQQQYVVPSLPKMSKQPTLLYWLMDSHRKEVNEKKEVICKEMELISQARGLMYVNQVELLLKQRTKSVQAVRDCLHTFQEQNIHE